MELVKELEFLGLTSAFLQEIVIESIEEVEFETESLLKDFNS